MCKLVKSLYGLKQAPKQWNQKFDQIILANGFKINQSNKCVYSKFCGDDGVIICLYVNDMLIFCTNFKQVEDTKNFLSNNFVMKDMGEANVILGIKILRDKDDITLTQSHYIEKVLKKFNHSNYNPASTPFDPIIKLIKNEGEPLSQLEYAKVIGCLC